MTFFLLAIGTAIDVATEDLFGAMDMAYDLGGGSLLPPILGTIVLTAGVLLTLS